MAGAASFEERFARDGYLVIDRLFDLALIDAARSEFDRQFPDLTRPPRHHLRVGNRRLQLPMEVRGPVADPMLSGHPLLIALLKKLLGLDLAIDSLACVVALPGARAQHLHRDHPPLFDHPDVVERPLPPFAITVAIPLIDLTPESGTTLVHPGSQSTPASDDGAAPDLRSPLSAFVNRGGCYLMDYGLWHQGMPNSSESPRPIIYLVYARSWFTDGSKNYQHHERLKISAQTLTAMPLEQRFLYRRAAAKGVHDLTPAELLSEPGGL